MFPDDVRETDSPQRKKLCNEVTDFLASPVNNSIQDLTVDELQSAIFSFSPFKAPNPDDSIYPVMLQKTFCDIVKDDIYLIINECLQAHS